MSNTPLRPAAQAFDAIASSFDERFGMWKSVSAQRRAVRAAMLQQFPEGGHLLEIGGGTGEDASFMASQGYQVLLTDPSPTMVAVANAKLESLGSRAVLVAAEDSETFAQEHLAKGGETFDGVFSNFAPLNCVRDLTPVVRGLSLLLKPGAAAILVVFGTCCPVEMIVEAVRGRPGQIFRRLKRGVVSTRLAKQHFDVVYHRRIDIETAFYPWFTLEKQLGIGVAVPPSAAEPWISHHPRLLSGLEAFDRALAGPLAVFGDHILYQFRRTDHKANAA